MKRTKKLMSASETCFYLRLCLGPVRAWGDFLSDLARSTPKNVHVHGLKLFPYGARRDRCRRPLYDPRELSAFIRGVWAADLSLRKRWDLPTLELFEIDDTPGVPWFVRGAKAA